MSDMHKDFKTWYARVDLGDDAARLTARWSGVEALAADAEYEQCQQFVDVFISRPGAAGGPGGDTIRVSMTEADSDFPESDNEAELGLIAEIALALVIDVNVEDSLAGITATLIYSALAGGIVSADTATGIIDRAKSAMRRQSALLRTRSRLPKAPESFAPQLNLSECVGDGENMSDVDQARQIMERVENKVTAAIGTLGIQARNERRLLENQLQIQDEELDMLWWASNGMSNTLGKSIAKLTDGMCGLAAAVDAADLTQFEPGPIAIAALLEKVGVMPRKKILISDAINAADETWLRQILPNDSTARTPLHYAIAKRLETPDPVAWPAAWGSITGIDHMKKVSELEIAYLFYQERLVLGQFGGG